MSAQFQAGLNVTAIGMTVVFVLLTLLVFIIRGMSVLSRKIEGPPDAAMQARDSAASLPQDELVSVISAAIAAYRQRH